MNERLQRDDSARAACLEYDRNARRYTVAFKKLRRKFTQRTYDFFSRKNLHDSIVISYGLDNDNRAYMLPKKGRVTPRLKPAKFRIVVRNGQEDRLHHIFYDGVIAVDIRPPESKGDFRINHLKLDYWWLNDEFSSPRRGVLCHEILFHSGAIWKIECKQISVRSTLYAA